MMLKKAVEANPGCDGVVLGGHGLFTWGDTQRECYLNTITIIDQLGQFVLEHVRETAGNDFWRSAIFDSAGCESSWRWRFSRFCVGGCRRSGAWIGTYCDLPEVLDFVNSQGRGEAGVSGDELSGSLYAHEDSTDVM